MERLSDALATCRVFVPLYSQRYFKSEHCGKEWFAFDRRRLNHQAGNARPVEAIVPVLWIPVRPDACFPEAARSVQFNSAGLGPLYAEHGFYGIMKVAGGGTPTTRRCTCSRGGSSTRPRRRRPPAGPVDYAVAADRLRRSRTRPVPVTSAAGHRRRAEPGRAARWPGRACTTAKAAQDGTRTAGLGRAARGSCGGPRQEPRLHARWSATCTSTRPSCSAASRRREPECCSSTRGRHCSRNAASARAGSTRWTSRGSRWSSCGTPGRRRAADGGERSGRRSTPRCRASSGRAGRRRRSRSAGVPPSRTSATVLPRLIVSGGQALPQARVEPSPAARAPVRRQTSTHRLKRTLRHRLERAHG